MDFKLIIKCQSLNETYTFDPNDFDDDIVGNDPHVKMNYWINMTLEDITNVTSELQDLIEAWLKFDESKYMALSLHKIGIVEFNKHPLF